MGVRRVLDHPPFPSVFVIPNPYWSRQRLIDGEARYEASKANWALIEIPICAPVRAILSSDEQRVFCGLQVNRRAKKKDSGIFPTA